MKFESQPTFKSLLFPGVTAKVRKLSHGMRTRIDMSLAKTREKIRELSDERAEIIDPAREAAEASVPADTADRDNAINEAIDKLISRDDKRILRDRLASINFLVYSEVQRGYLDEAVKSIAGLDVDIEGDGNFVPCTTIPDLIEHGPPELVQEIYDAIQSGISGLSADERKNSPSPSTSPAPGEEATNDTIAAPVSEPVIS
jgi:hypothetical protein